MSSDEESKDSKENYMEKRDKTIMIWNELLDDPFCEYYGLDHVSAIDILVAYDKKRIPVGLYDIEEYEAYDAITDTLHRHSLIKLNFRDLLHSIVCLQEFFYFPIQDAEGKRSIIYQEW